MNSPDDRAAALVETLLSHPHGDAADIVTEESNFTNIASDAAIANPAAAVVNAAGSSNVAVAGRDRAAAAVRDATVERLAAIWREVFALGAVSPADSFFALGGDSLSAAQIVASVNQDFGIDLPIDAPFEAPLLADLAAVIAGMCEAEAAVAVGAAAGAAAGVGQPLTGGGAPDAAVQHADTAGAAGAADAGPAAPGPAGAVPELTAAQGAVPERTAPLSFAQRRLWFLHQLDPLNPVHNIAALLRLSGPLDRRALALALATIVRRHHALRTVFRAAGSEPSQQTATVAAGAAAVVALPGIDLTALPAAARRREWERSAALVARMPFGLEDGVLLRAALIAGAPCEHGLVLAWHHIAADGWSLGVFLRELTAGYQALRGGGSWHPANLPLQYADFATWQRGWLRDQTLAARLDFWRLALAGAPPALELPADRPRPTVLSHRGAHHERRLPGRLTERLAATAHDGKASVFMALLCGFAALLTRLTGEEDLVLGTPIAGRQRRDLEPLIGVFINNLVLRIDAAGDPSFRQLLARVRQAALAAYAHQEVPFEAVVDALGGQRDLSRTPLFQVLFVEQSAPLRRAALADLTVEPREIDLGTARFDLALAVAPVEDGWLGTWKYSTDLFDAPTPMRMAVQLEALLDAAAAQPDVPLSRLAWFAAGERHQVLSGWNDTAVRYADGGVCLHQLIAAQAARTPAAIAVSAPGVDLTYGALERQAGQLARHLGSLGVAAESLVGVAAERSAEMVVGLLAVLKAGAAYVPFDPGYPAERLRFMLDDARVGVLLTQSHLAAALPPHAARVVLLDAPFSGAAAAPAVGAAWAHADSPAYAIYTSGSTGRPKGAVVTHRGIVNRLLWMQQEYGLAADDRVLQKTPYSFDVSVWEFFWPLIAGARLVMAPPGAHQDPAWLARIVQAQGITTLHFVPSMLQAFLALAGEDLAAVCRTVRRVMASGEALPAELAERALARLGAPLHNLYGPTEASVDVSFHACQSDGGRRPVPIGRPIANLSLYVVDRHGDAVPPGVPGELLIGGVGLARGYLNRPELTAARFVPHPWDERGGGRLYRTGDLARFRPDGAIEFLGRLDHQVKVRGVRIELGEIEAALVRHPRVREAVVMLQSGAPSAAPRSAGAPGAVAPRSAGAPGAVAPWSAGAGEPRLVAYLTLTGTANEPGAAELRRFLGDSLPDAMVPSAFVVLPALPLTPSGKVDRRALAALDGVDLAAPARERPWTAPATALERHLAGLWQELLRVERVGRDDSFFELGGDSIQGAMFINRLQADLGEILYVMALFDAPTVAGFAAFMERAYPVAAARLGAAPAGAPVEVPGAETVSQQVDELDVEAALAAVHAAAVRRLGRGAVEQAERAGQGAARRRNARAVFILAPFRSGTTLLRVMLAGHSRLFAPPELELLGFGTMAERAGAYAGRNAFALEGLLRAVMELRDCDADAARAWVAQGERDGLTVADVYRQLQEAGGGRLLVDKTPSYALDIDTLRRAEQMFDQPLYVHLVRHPRATIDSYVEAHMDQVYDFPFAPTAQAELVWMLCHRNILDFVAEMEPRRVHRLRFEELVKTPRQAMTALCDFVGVPFEDALLAPYEGRRMADGLHAASRMMGDPKFHQHRGIAAEVADRYKQAAGALRPQTWQLAARLGYQVPAGAGVAATPAGAAAPSEPAALTGAGGAAAPADADAVTGAAGAAPAAAGAGSVLVPVPRQAGAVLPLSYAQERLWFLAQLDPASPAYNMPATVMMEGALKVDSLARAFDAVRRRHEVLRTTFPAVAGLPVLAVSEDASGALPVVDLGGLPADRRRPEMERLALAEGRRPFDLAGGPRAEASAGGLPRSAGRAEASAGGPPRPAGLLRTTVISLGSHLHALLATMHHIVSDGWTIGILTHELAVHYRASVLAQPAVADQLPALRLQYADYAAWQRRWLDDQAVAGHLDYWRRRLSGWLPPMDWPTDRPRPANQTSRGARVSRTLAAAPAQALREWSRQQGTTPFLTLLAAWSALSWRCTAQEDLLLGIPIANRNRVEVEGLIGFFLNMVVARTDASGDPTLRELLRRASDGFLSSVPHQEVPFEKLVEALHLPRDRSRTPVFQAQFSLQNTPSAPLALPGLTLEMVEIHNRTTKFDFTVFLVDRPDGLTTTLEYNTDLFDAVTMTRLLAAWETLLAGVPTAADRRLSDLPLLPAAERAQLLAPWPLAATTAAAFGAAPAAVMAPPAGAVCLHELFEQQVRRQPRAVAVVHELEELTYQQLNRRANQLARRLRALGVGPETPVGLCVERSPRLLVGILGILKAGGAYVPLDPAYPRERLVYTLADALAGAGAAAVQEGGVRAGASPAVLVTEAGVAALIGDDLPFALTRVDFDRDGASLAGEDGSNVGDVGDVGNVGDVGGGGRRGDGGGGGAAVPANLAYVIYTSGSTGRPKGVPVTHANGARLLAATAHWFGFGSGDVWTLFHSAAFDFSVWEIWGALALGGRLVIVPRQATLSPALLLELLAGEKVTVLNQTPSAFRQLAVAAAADRRRLPALRWVIFGGEALPLDALAPWLALYGPSAGPRLINMYGITETTVHVTYRPIAAGDLARPGNGNAPIGEPIPDLRVHLLGPRGELVPVGVAGEIHVGGAGVARGYLHRPDLTARRFVPDAWGGQAGARLYASGDLARRRPDGDLEYLGRIDHQVKVRGFRIELGEIEAVLRAHPRVQDAVVTLRHEDGGGATPGTPGMGSGPGAPGAPGAPAAPGDHRLVAHFVPRPGSAAAAPVDAAELRAHLRSLLPEYMVPAAFVALAAMPLTPSGKIDRRALPSAGGGADATATAAAATAVPRTPTERRLAQIWLEVLRIEQAGRDDNFFDLGGHSLLVTQLASRIQTTFGVALPMASVFDAPTLAGLAARIDALLPEAPAGGEAGAGDAAAASGGGGGLPPIPRVARNLLPAAPGAPGSPASLPPSFAQERLWFLDQLQPDSPFYNVPLSLRLRGRLNVAALVATFGEIVRRHETLRTSFAAANGQPVQVVAPAVAVPIPIVDVSGLAAEARREALLAQLAHDEARQPFNLAGGPRVEASAGGPPRSAGRAEVSAGGPPRPAGLLRLRLIRLGAQDHALLATVHHIVSDGWSLGVLIREVAALYTACCQGRPSPLLPLAIQYADFAAWQRGWLQGERLDQELDFWRGQLDGAPQVIELPADRPRPPRQGFAGRHLRFVWPPALAARLRALGRSTGTTLFMSLFAALAVQLHRYTGLGDFLIGSPVANRQRRELEDLIGFFVNTLVLRARLHGEQTVEELLAGVRATTLAAFARQDLPFEKLVHHPAVTRDASRSPLFQVFLVLQNAPAETLELPGLTLETLAAESGAAKFDLTLSFAETAAGLDGFLEYSTDLFDEATAARMLAHQRNLLESLAAGEGWRLADLAMLGAAERRQLLTAWGGAPAATATAVTATAVTAAAAAGAVPAPAQQHQWPSVSFHRLFERRAQALPHAPAMASDGRLLLTYGELNQQANQLAHHLRRLGIGPELRVAIALPRSPMALVAIVATLKTGAAYVPLDPSHPLERLALIVEDTAPTLLLTDERSRGELPVPGNCKVFYLDGAWEPDGALAGEPSTDLPPGAADDCLDSPAYAIFTSGTTGRPKGVPISHRALTNFLLGMQQRPGLTAADVVVAAATISFDIHTLELLLPLIVGARIELLTREEAMDGALLVERLDRSQATLFQATPSGWRILLDAGWRGNDRLAALCGGEALTPELAARLLPRVGSLWNVYGPTETTVWSVVERVAPETAAGGGAERGAVPIGRPIPNFNLFILDRYLEPVPAGVIGELYIGGIGLSRGYFVSPDLTAGRFLPHPFAGAVPGEQRGARLYRSGDLVRHRANGDIEFLGRADHQVKIRGFRIEPDEVAAVLAQHPAVRKAVVVPRPAAGGDLALVAYFVAADPAPEIADLRTFLKDKLPAYMVPADFVSLAAFPLAPTGKIDRRALPAPGAAAPSQSYAAPQTPTEEQLVEIWQQVLDRPQVGIHDNFFELGGHSLLAPQIIARIDTTFQVRLPLRTFFEAPTIGGMAAHIDLIILQEIEALSEEEAELAAP